MPHFEPMRLARRPAFDHPDWIYEIKFDRMIALGMSDPDKPQKELKLDITISTGAEGSVNIVLKRCALETCQKLMDPKRPGQRFCSAAHRKEYHNLQRKLA